MDGKEEQKNQMETIRQRLWKTEGFGRRGEGYFSNKMSLTVDIIPEMVTEASKDSGKLSMLSSIKWVAARSFPSIINLAKQRAN